MIITLAGGGSTFTPGIVKSIALRKEELEVEEIRLYDHQRGAPAQGWRARRLDLARGPRPGHQVDGHHR
ncbi:MAG: hypothetical protein ACLTSX_05300 [Collinsella sp.]